MRVISYSNLWGDISKPEIIPNSSLTPIKVIAIRIKELMLDFSDKDRQKLWGISHKNDVEKVVIFTVICEMLYLFLNEKSRFYVTVKSLSGYSIRRALELIRLTFGKELSERAKSLHLEIVRDPDMLNSISLMNNISEIVLNDTIQYFYQRYDDFKQSNITKDLFYTNLLYRSSINSSQNIYIENLCVDDNNKFTLIKFRILFYLEENRVTNIGELIKYLNLFNYSFDEVIDSLNSMSHQNRRLIFFNVPVFISTTNYLNGIYKNKISLTTTGNGYYKLIEFNSVTSVDYFTFCFNQQLNKFGKTPGEEILRTLIKNLLKMLRLEIDEVNHLMLEYNDFEYIKSISNSFFSFRLFMKYFQRNLVSSLSKMHYVNSNIFEIFLDLKSFFEKNLFDLQDFETELKTINEMYKSVTDLELWQRAEEMEWKF
ncbi:MAG: hypothetical protein IPK25_08735 [Saprospiraceae bacterium]|nr:hypothetical protein [Saprospiraceae bacterium]